MKRLLLSVLLLSLAALRLAAFDFTPCKGFIPVPEYSDRAGWDALTGTAKKSAVRFAEQYLGRDWSAAPVSNKHREALSNLIIGELFEGEGRFVPEISKALTAVCERGYLSNNASDAAIPAGHKKIALMEAAYGSELAFALYYLRDALPEDVCKAVEKCLKENIFDPFLDDERAAQMNWIAENFTPGGKAYLNNWVPYCNTHVLAAFLLAEPDPERLRKAVERSFRSMDKYVTYCAQDGSCEEGPAYWNMAGAKVYEYAKMIYEASGGAIDRLDEPVLREMGEWRICASAGDGMVVNFSDTGLKDISYAEMYFRIGTDCGSQALVDFAVLSSIKPDFSGFRGPSLRGGPEGNRIQRALENLLIRDAFREAQQEALDSFSGNYVRLYDAYYSRILSRSYPDNQQAFLRAGKNFLFVKGGHNNEAHNHLDVGTPIFFSDMMPVIIDPGLNHDTYAALHEGNKYKVWSARSEWHSLPVINGCQQVHGREHCAEGFSADGTCASFDISKAYPASSLCRRWVRSYSLSAKGLEIVDDYQLEARTASDTLNFIVWQEPSVSGREIVIPCRSLDGTRSGKMHLQYPSEMKVELTPMDVSANKDLKKVWKDRIWRISLISPSDSPAKGSYRFILK